MTYSAREVVVVTWLDIVTRADWVGDHREVMQEMKPEPCLSVGWILHDDKKFIILADSLTRDKTYGGVTVIPRAVVVRVEVLAEVLPSSRFKGI